MRPFPQLWRLVAIWAALSACGDPDLVAPGTLEYVTAPVTAGRAPAKLRVAAVALRVARDKERNLTNLERTVDEIAAGDPEVGLIHFGEATLGWYLTDDDTRAYQRELAEPLTGPAATRLRAVARRHGIYLAWGMIERASTRLYNTLVLADPNGEIAAVHRKMLLFENDEEAGIHEAPPNVQIVDIAGLRVGLMICFDGKSAWLQRELTERRADLVLLSIASDMPRSDVSPTARRLGAWLSVANRFGEEDDFEYSGDAYVSDDFGTVRAENHGKAGYVIVDIEAAP